MKFLLIHCDMRALTLIVTSLLSAPLAHHYSVNINPEVTFFKSAVDVKREWEQELHREGRSIMFSGGSTSAFQIDSELLLDEFDIASVNAGLAAGMGLDGTVAIASTLLQKGDELVLMTEPALLGGGGGQLNSLGSQIIMATDSNSYSNLFLQKIVTEEAPYVFYLNCKPGLHHSVVMLAKILRRKEAYHYTREDIHPGGLLSTSIRMKIDNATLHNYRLSPAGRIFITELKTWTDSNGIRLSYLLPVSYVQAANVESQRQINQLFLDEISEIIPVWSDSYLGASNEPADFSNSYRHMTLMAARTRTRELASAHTARSN